MDKINLILSFALAASAMTPSGVAQAQPAPPIIYQPDPDSPIGERNPDAPDQSQQLDFLVGDWDVAVILHPPQGNDISYQARWHNSWIVDGHVVMQEWRGPFATGAELRSFNLGTGQWEGRNYYTHSKTWTASTGDFADGEFIVETRHSGPPGAFISRERYFDIQPNSFRMSATRSYDEGATWSSLTYEMLCTRSD